MHLVLLDVPPNSAIERRVRQILGGPEVIEATPISGIFNLLVRAQTDSPGVLEALRIRLLEAGVRDARSLTTTG